MINLQHLLSDFGPKILGGKKYDAWKEQSFSLQKVKIRNKKIATELEKACEENGGFLTYSEYLQIEQFGKNGYHATHQNHGFTPSFKLWAETVLLYLKNHDIHSVIETGPGGGHLLEQLIKKAKKEKFHFLWYGVEIEKKFHSVIKKYADASYVGNIYQFADELPKIKKTLVISSYCMDSIPPEIIVNVSHDETRPNGIMGIQVKNGVLEEFILTPAQQKQKNLSLHNGILTKNGLSLDYSSWKLPYMKRLHTHLESFLHLRTLLQKTLEPHLLLVDEMRKSISDQRFSEHMFPPVFLNVKNRYTFSNHTSYERAGELLYYYPLFLPLLITFLQSLTFQHIIYDAEPKMATLMLGKQWEEKKYIRHLCYGLLASGQKDHSLGKQIVKVPFS